MLTKINISSSLSILLFVTSVSSCLLAFLLSKFFSCALFVSFQSILTSFSRPESLLSSPQGCNRSQRTHSRWQQRQHHHLHPDLGSLAGWLWQQIASRTRRYDKCVCTFPSSLSPVSTCWPVGLQMDHVFPQSGFHYTSYHKSHTSEIHDRLCFGTVKLLIFSWHCNVYQ